MKSISHKIGYLPHDLKTKYQACKSYSSNRFSVRDICRLYHISKASLMRWMNKYDGSKESLHSISKKPHSLHPNAHTIDEIKSIELLLNRNPNIGLSELYGKLRRNYAYTRHPASLFRFLRKKGVYVSITPPKQTYIPKPYDTPKTPGEKMQMDVKFVPKQCYSSISKDKFYQYTIIDEATRERFIYAYNEHSSFSTVDFVVRAVIYFGYIPKCIQTDNGLEFTKHHTKVRHIHIFDKLCNDLNIVHKLIKPRTPRHNGKVERSHRNDQNRFYNQLSFYSLNDLQIQMKAYLRRSNDIPSSSLKWLSPLELRKSLINIKKHNRSILKNYTNLTTLINTNI